MNERDIEHMWKVASNNPNHDTNWHDPVVIAFANLVAAQEREACANVCDGLADMHAKMNQWSSQKTADTLAQAIRARGQAND